MDQHERRPEAVRSIVPAERCCAQGRQCEQGGDEDRPGNRVHVEQQRQRRARHRHGRRHRKVRPLHPAGAERPADGREPDHGQSDGRHRSGEAVVIVGLDGRRRTAEQAIDRRNEGSGGHHDPHPGEEHAVGVERRDRLPGSGLGRSVGRPEQAVGHHRTADQYGDGQHEQTASGIDGLGERVHRAGGAGSGQNDAECGGGECDDGEADERDRRPSSTSGSAGGVECAGDPEPGEERGVLDRVPGPEATPPDLDIGPGCADDHAEGQGEPRQPQPTPNRFERDGSERGRFDRGDVGIGGGVVGGGGQQGEGYEGRREPEVEQRRVHDHGRMAEHGDEPSAVDGGNVEPGERGREEQSERELDPGHRGDDPGHRRPAEPSPAAPDHRHRPESQMAPGPEQQRTLHAAPQPGQSVGGRGAAGRGVGHVHQFEGAGQKGVRQ